MNIVRSLHKHEGQWTFADTKRVRSRRVVKLQTWVLELLRKLKDKADAAGKTRDSAFADLILTTARDEQINEEYLVKKHFKPLLREAGLPNIRLYDLRHTRHLPLRSELRPKWCLSNSDTPALPSRWILTPTCSRICRMKLLPRWKRL